MTAICQAESHGNVYAINTHNTDGLDDFGLLQLHGQDILNPAANITAGHEIWLKDGYRAWTSYVTGAYKTYL